MKLLAEWWSSIWPNLAASGITFSSGLAWARRRFLREWEKRELEHLTHHKETHTLIKNLHAKVEQLNLGQGQPPGKAEE